MVRWLNSDGKVVTLALFLAINYLAPAQNHQGPCPSSKCVGSLPLFKTTRVPDRGAVRQNLRGPMGYMEHSAASQFLPGPRHVRKDTNLYIGCKWLYFMKKYDCVLFLHHSVVIFLQEKEHQALVSG